jgi:Fibronectin type III domain
VVPEAPTKPDAPIIGTASAGNTQATVTFGPPAFNGGSAVTSYTLTATDSTNSATGGETATGSASPITVTGLTNGDTYTFTVTATNAIGTGPASAASNPVVPEAPTVPGAPIIGTATAADTTATVTFSPPPFNGGSAITSYTVTAIDSTTPADGGQTGSGPASPMMAAGASGRLTFSGTGFEARTKLGGPAVVKASQLSVSATIVTATITVAAGAATGAYTVTVTNPDSGVATCTTCLVVIAAPTLTAINPQSAAQGTATPVTVTGTGFATGAKLTGPSGVTFSKVTVANSTTITAIMTISGTAPTGTNLAVNVTNTAAGGYGYVTSGLLNITGSGALPYLRMEA